MKLFSRSTLTHPRRWQRMRFSGHDQLPEIPGLYAVMRGREVLYIGLSKNIHQRWNATGDRRHGRYWLASIRASHIAYIRTLDYVRQENRYIKEFRPPWNDISYPWFWDCDRPWLGRLGALGWLVWAKRKQRRRVRLWDVVGVLAVWVGVVLVCVVIVSFVGGS